MTPAFGRKDSGLIGSHKLAPQGVVDVGFCHPVGFVEQVGVVGEVQVIDLVQFPVFRKEYGKGDKFVREGIEKMRLRGSADTVWTEFLLSGRR